MPLKTQCVAPSPQEEGGCPIAPRGGALDSAGSGQEAEGVGVKWTRMFSVVSAGKDEAQSRGLGLLGLNHPRCSGAQGLSPVVWCLTLV